MNPQFQNMMGMGRGISTGNMQQLQQQPQQMNNTNNSIKLQQYIIQSLSQDGPFQGWQADVPISERAGKVRLLVDSLRMLGPAAVEMSRAVDVALNFERKEFAQQPSREAYHRECQEKLGKIRDQRQQTFKMQNMGVPNPAMMANNPAFQQQLQQAQAQQLGRNPNMPQQGMQPGMQPSPAVNQQFGQQNMVQNLNPQANQMRLNMAQNPAQRPLSQEDNSKINQRAAELARNTPQEEMQAIMDNMDPGLKQNCTSKGIEPIAYHFRIAAIREFRQRQMQTGAAALNPQRVNLNNGNFNVMGQMAGVQQNPVNPMLNQGQNQANDNPFMSNVDQLRNQQAAALRLQEEGQMVVPASTNNATADQLRLQQQLPAGQQRVTQANPGMNPQFLAQQQQMMKANIQQQQQQQQQRMNAAQQQAAKSIQNGSAGQGMQGQNPMQGMAQQQNTMNMLNRPVGPNKPGASPQPARPASRQPIPGQTPQLNQQTQPNQSQLSAQQVQQREGFLSTLPPQLQAILRSKPSNEWTSIIAKWRQAQSAPNNMNRSNSQQPGNLQAGQGTAPQFVNGTGPSPMQQSLSAGQIMNVQPTQMGNSGIPNVGQQQNVNAQMAANSELIRQRQMQMQQQQARMAGQGGQINGNDLPKRPLSQQEMAIMDQQPVHPGLLRQIQAFLQTQGNFLPEIKTWMQLKNWLSANPLPKFNMHILSQVQATQFHAVRARQIQNQQGNNLGQMPNAPQAPAPMPMNAQQPQMSIMAMNRPITDQDIQRVRASNPRIAQLSDEQIRQTLLTRRKQLQDQQKIMMQQRGQQPGQIQPSQVSQPMQQQPSQQGVMMQPQSSQMSNSMGMAQQQQLQMQIQNQNQVQNNAVVQRPGSNRQLTQSQQAQGNVTPQVDQKTLKRPNDDGTDAAIPQNRSAMPEQLRGGIPNLTKEQFDKLDPMKKRQYVEARRRQEIVMKITELGREIQSTMPPSRPITNLDANSKKRIIALLTSDSTRNMLIRFDSFLVGYYMVEKDDATLKQLMNQRNHLAAQYKPQSFANKTFEPNDQFSITAENVETIITNITQKFQQTSAKYGKSQQQSMPLTAENLAQAQAQAAREKKGPKGKEAPPPAPTGEKPPFPLGDTRGQGTPTYAPAPGLKQEDLKLDPKRRKKNPLANTATAQSASPEITKEQKAPIQSYRCAAPECQHQNKVFPSHAILDEHVKSVHQRPEAVPVTDAPAFLDTTLREVFHLDENFQPMLVQKIESAQPAPMMQRTLSKAGSNLKIESKPSTPVAMVRGTSQQTSKAGLPSTPNLLKTPQSTHDTIKSVAQKSSGTPQDINSSWANSSFSLSQLNDTFGNIEWSDVMPGLDSEKPELDGVLHAYMQGDQWQKIMSGGSSDNSTDKSKSPAQGSESIVPVDISVQKQGTQGSNIDLVIDGVDMAEGFESLIMGDVQLQAADDGDFDGDWEFPERPTPPEAGQVLVDASNPFASDTDPDLAAWLNEPVTMSGFNDLGPDGFPDIDTMSPFEEIVMDEWLQKPSNDSQLKATTK